MVFSRWKSSRKVRVLAFHAGLHILGAERD
jgi:hypothetical protein